MRDQNKTKQTSKPNCKKQRVFKLLQSPGKQRQTSSYQLLEGRVSPWTPYRAWQYTVSTQFVFAALKPLRSTWSRKGNTCLPVFSLRLNISETLPIFSVLCTSLNWWQETRCPQSFVLCVLSLAITVIPFPFILMREKVMAFLVNDVCLSTASKDDKSKGHQAPVFHA